eukprot:TRINITY_DN907_c0_g1_i1.p1 TRINITY_DN907_c0_g1~~TRINITY_DN907_c0_g1_i1.p1  ORF type:complete len:283 (+),score=28.70 TRINITY_DN907_c0_g1_i1:109-957(+)
MKFKHLEPVRPASGALRVALVFGWYLGQHNQVQKYSNWYTDRGFHVLQVLKDGGPVVRGQESTRLLITDMLTYLQDKILSHNENKEEQPEPPIIVCHLFSNGGLHNYFQMLELVEHDARFQNLASLLRATVLDSAPADVTIASGVRAMSAHIKSSVVRYVAMFLLLVWLLYRWVLHRVKYYGLGKWCRGERRPYGNDGMGMHILFESPLIRKMPCLYLYSKADRITDYRFVAQTIEKQRQLGMKVDSYEFGRSPHVLHLRSYPHLYADALSGFYSKHLELRL